MKRNHESLEGVDIAASDARKKSRRKEPPTPEQLEFARLVRRLGALRHAEMLPVHAAYWRLGSLVSEKRGVGRVQEWTVLGDLERVNRDLNRVKDLRAVCGSRTVHLPDAHASWARGIGGKAIFETQVEILPNLASACGLLPKVVRTPPPFKGAAEAVEQLCGLRDLLLLLRRAGSAWAPVEGKALVSIGAPLVAWTTDRALHFLTSDGPRVFAPQHAPRLLELVLAARTHLPLPLANLLLEYAF